MFFGAGHFWKSVVFLDKVLSIKLHGPTGCIQDEYPYRRNCQGTGVKENVAQFHHYRNKCLPQWSKSVCEEDLANLVQDRNLTRFFDRIEPNMRQVAKELKELEKQDKIMRY